MFSSMPGLWWRAAIERRLPQAPVLRLQKLQHELLVLRGCLSMQLRLAGAGAAEASGIDLQYPLRPYPCGPLGILMMSTMQAAPPTPLKPNHSERYGT